MFKRMNEYSIETFQLLTLHQTQKDINYGLETVTSWVPTIWAERPSEYKLANYFKECKVKIKTWKCDMCPCRSCKMQKLDSIFETDFVN